MTCNIDHTKEIAQIKATKNYNEYLILLIVVK